MKKIKKFTFIAIIMVIFAMFIYAFYKVEVDNAMPKIAILSEKIAIDKDSYEITFIDNKGDIRKYISDEKEFDIEKWVKSYENGEIYNTIKIGEVDKDELYKQYKNIKRSSLIPFDTLHDGIYGPLQICIVTPDYYWYGVCYDENGIRLIPLYQYGSAKSKRSYLWTTKKVNEWFGNYVKIERK